MKNLYFFFFLILMSCNDDDLPTPNNPIDDLPPITMSGASTFGCLLNGEPWVPKGGSFATPRLDAYYSEIFTKLSISGFTNKTNGSEFVFFNSNFIAEGEYSLSGGGLSGFADSSCGIFHDLDTLSSHGIIVTKFDTINRIVSGEFFFTAISNGCSDTIKVTDGRFDVVYRE